MIYDERYDHNLPFPDTLYRWLPDTRLVHSGARHHAVCRIINGLNCYPINLGVFQTAHFNDILGTCRTLVICLSEHSDIKKYPYLLTALQPDEPPGQNSYLSSFNIFRSIYSVFLILRFLQSIYILSSLYFCHGIEENICRLHSSNRSLWPASTATPPPLSPHYRSISCYTISLDDSNSLQTRGEY